MQMMVAVGRPATRDAHLQAGLLRDRCGAADDRQSDPAILLGRLPYAGFMPDITGTFERAMEMAASREFDCINAIRQALKREGRADVGSELKSLDRNRRLVNTLRGFLVA